MLFGDRLLHLEAIAEVTGLGLVHYTAPSRNGTGRLLALHAIAWRIGLGEDVCLLGEKAGEPCFLAHARYSRRNYEISSIGPAWQHTQGPNRQQGEPLKDHPRNGC